MIITKLLGGLGNQLFQYAVGRSLAEKRGTELGILKKTFEFYALRDYKLGAFNITAREASVEEAEAVLKKCGGAGSETERRFLPEILNAPADTFLQGDFQSPLYFEDIEDILRKEFTLKSPLEKKAAVWEKRIANAKNPVSLHIRRGDYMKNPMARKNFGVLPKEYYFNAIEEIKKDFGDFTLFIFSDEPAAAKKELNLPKNISAEFVKGVTHDYEEMYLMSRCAAHIIANSSFSWWGAWLDDNPEKIVIAPAPWFIAPINNKDILPKEWKTVPSMLDKLPPPKAARPLFTAVVYAGENYLDTLKSVMEQDKFEGDDLEIIAPDTKEAKELLASRENISFISPTLSIGAFYNMGIKSAKGEYMMFFDGQDAIESRYISFAYNQMDNTKADAAHPVLWYVEDAGGSLQIGDKKYSVVSDGNRNGMEFVDPRPEVRLEMMGQGLLNANLTGKIFRRGYLTAKKISFNENLKIGEDIDFMMAALCNGAAYIKIPIGGRIVTAEKKARKETLSEDLRKFLQSIRSRISTTTPQDTLIRVLGLMALSYVNEYVKGVEGEMSVLREVAAVAGEFGVRFEVKNEEKEEEKNSLNEKMMNVSKQIENINNTIDRIEILLN